MDDNGGFKWWIVICLMVAWIIVYFIVMKGIQSSGKVRLSKRSNYKSINERRLVGCLLHISISVCCPDNIFYSWCNARRCWGRLNTHVYAEGSQAFRSFRLAGCGHAGVLLIRVGIRIVNSVRKLQHPQEQLRSRCVAGLVLQCCHGYLRISCNICHPRLQSHKKCWKVLREVKT